jgi:N,N'-diacetylbacillosaminyl-diphospho-undecaprenol alpha-1,3-N-acetylgalactosaminyltransferase
MLVANKPLTRNEIIAEIWETVPVGAAEPTEPKTLARLTELTNSLIDLTGREELKVNPFTEVCDRNITLYKSQIATILQDKVVLITGGAGFVGSNLISHLSQFGVKKIVSVDMEYASSIKGNISIVHYQTDIRDYEALHQIFEIEQPNVVFHLAAQRLPGLAETQVYQTISTNIFGTENIIKLCEKYQIEACIFSSTGKASRYYTPDVYAGSKKIAEWLFSDRLDTKKSLYGIVRFTHVVENSPISAELDRRVEQGVVSMHAPDRFTYAQNVTEAVYLLLNALTMLERGTAKLFAVKSLGWPINTLNIALHKIVVAGGNIPIYFKGVPKGYESHMFMGHLDLSGEKGIIPMLNVLEVEKSYLSPAQDTVISALHPFSSQLVSESLRQIRQAAKGSDTAFKAALNNGVRQMAISTFWMANPFKLLEILGWGIDPQHLANSNVDANYYHGFAEILLIGIDRRLPFIPHGQLSPQVLNAIEYLQSISLTSRSASYVASKITKLQPAPVKVVHNIHFPVSARSFVAPIVESLNQAGVSTELWVENKPKHAHVLNEINVPKQIINSDIVRNPIEICRRIYRYYQKLKQTKPEILHVHQSRAALIPLIAGSLAQVPVRIYHNHGIPYFGYTGIMRWLLKSLERINIQLATHILLVSKSNLEVAKQDGILDNRPAGVIASGSIAGIDMDRYDVSKFDRQHQRSARIEFGIESDSFVLGYVGRPVKRKGFHRLLSAWKASGLGKRGGTLLIAGCSLNECREAMGEQLEGVRALGYLSDLAEFYAACDATALPSYHEGFGYAILESAAACRPSIGSDIPGIQCAIEHNVTGLLVSTDDDLGLVRAIQTLASNVELRLRLGAAARRRVELQFSREIVMEDLLKFYQQILRDKKMNIQKDSIAIKPVILTPITQKVQIQ